MGETRRPPPQRDQRGKAVKRAAIYARVSTHHGQNPGMQLEEVRTYCTRRDWKIVREYVDTGISGAKEHRPALETAS